MFLYPEYRAAVCSEISDHENHSVVTKLYNLTEQGAWVPTYEGKCYEEGRLPIGAGNRPFVTLYEHTDGADTAMIDLDHKDIAELLSLLKLMPTNTEAPNDNEG